MSLRMTTTGHIDQQLEAVERMFHGGCIGMDGHIKDRQKSLREEPMKLWLLSSYVCSRTTPIRTKLCLRN